MKTTFVDGNKPLGIRGTVVSATLLNALNNHRHDGLAEDGHGAIDYAADAGAANAYVVNLSPALTAHVTGMPIFFKAVNANTGPSTINVNGLGAVSIRKHGTVALAAGDIGAGQMICVIYDGTYYQLLPGMVAALTGDPSQIFSAADGTSGKQVVNRSQFPSSGNVNGYMKFPNGIVLQWGLHTFSGAGGAEIITLPTTFNGLWNASATVNRSTTCDSGILIYSAYVQLYSTSQLILVLDGYAAVESGQSVFWQAIGW